MANGMFKTFLILRLGHVHPLPVYALLSISWSLVHLPTYHPNALQTNQQFLQKQLATTNLPLHLRGLYTSDRKYVKGEYENFFLCIKDL